MGSFFCALVFLWGFLQLVHFENPWLKTEFFPLLKQNINRYRTCTIIGCSGIVAAPLRNQAKKQFSCANLMAQNKNLNSGYAL